MNGNTIQSIDEWAKHLEDFVQEIHNKVDKDNPLYQDIVNLLDSVKCLPDWVHHDRRHYTRPVELPGTQAYENYCLSRERMYQGDNLDK